MSAHGYRARFWREQASWGSLKRPTAVAALIGWTTLASGGTVPFFTGLGQLPGGTFSRATSVSADGTTAVGWGTNDDQLAFRWTEEEGLIQLGDLPGGGVGSVAFDVSADGSYVVGWSASANGREAYRWSWRTGMVGLGDLPGGGFESRSLDVSHDGSVVVGWGTTDTGSQAFRWTSADGLVSLGHIPGAPARSQSRAVTPDGSVVVGWAASPSGEGTEPFRWTAETGMVGLGQLPGGSQDAIAMGVSADGSIVVGWADTDAGRLAFRWTESEGMVPLSSQPGLAADISEDGSVIVGRLFRDADVAVIWDADGMHELQPLLEEEFGLDLSDWILTSVRGVSADGTVFVGDGFHNGVTEAWIAAIPEPSSLLLAGLLAAVGISRRSVRS